MAFFIGLHNHVHGTSVYLFEQQKEPTLKEFRSYLSEEFEENREGEFLEIIPARPEHIPEESEIETDSF